MTTTNTWLMVGGLMLALIGWVGGYCFGFLMGVKDTERRWTEAVDRAVYARRSLAGTE